MKRILCFSLLLLPFLPVAKAVNPSHEDSLVSVLGQSSTDTSKIRIMTMLSESLWRIRKLDQAENYASQAIQLTEKLLAEKPEDVFLQLALAKNLNSLASVFREKINYDKAIEYNKKAAGISEQLRMSDKNNQENNTLLAFTYNFIGGTYFFKSDYDKALEAYLKSLKLFEETGNIARVGSAFHNIGQIYNGRSDYQKAEEYYLKALSIFTGLKNNRGIASNYEDLGSVSLRIGIELAAKGKKDSAEARYSAALEYHLKALKLNSDAGNKNWMAYNYNNIGVVYEEKKDFGNALKCFNKALQIREEIIDIKGISDSHVYLGNFFLKIQKIPEAKKEFFAALRIASEGGIKDNLRESYLSLAVCDSILGDFKGAFRYHQMYSAVKDSILDEASSRQIAEMQTRYDTEKKDKENALLTQQNEMNSLEIKHQKNQRNILIFGIFLLLVLGGFIYNSTRLKHLNKILVEKESRNIAVFQAQEKEKVDLSRELHDGLGPLLSLIKLNVSALDTNSKNEKLVPEINQLVTQSIKEVRNISHTLMPATLQKQGLSAALQEFVSRLNVSDNLKTDLHFHLTTALDKTIELNIFRIVQEGMNNIMKHSGATHANIDLNENNGTIELNISDDGKGFYSKNMVSGNGLNNISSRVDFLKGTLDVQSAPGKGTHLILKFPLNGKT